MALVSAGRNCVGEAGAVFASVRTAISSTLATGLPPEKLARTSMKYVGAITSSRAARFLHPPAPCWQDLSQPAPAVQPALQPGSPPSYDRGLTRNKNLASRERRKKTWREIWPSCGSADRRVDRLGPIASSAGRRSGRRHRSPRPLTSFYPLHLRLRI